MTPINDEKLSLFMALKLDGQKKQTKRKIDTDPYYKFVWDLMLLDSDRRSKIHRQLLEEIKVHVILFLPRKYFQKVQ